MVWSHGYAFWPSQVEPWIHASDTPWVQALRQLRAARRATLLPGNVLDTGHLCPRWPGRDSSVPSSHRASSCGILGTQSCPWASLPSTRFHLRPSPGDTALWGLQTGQKPGSWSLCQPLLPGPKSRVQPQAAFCSGPGLFFAASAPLFVSMVLRRMS